MVPCLDRTVVYELNFILIKDVDKVLNGKTRKTVLMTLVLQGLRIWVNPALVLCGGQLPSLYEHVQFNIRPLPHLHRAQPIKHC